MLNNEVGFTLECRPGPGVRIFEVCLLLRGLREASISDSCHFLIAYKSVRNGDQFASLIICARQLSCKTLRTEDTENISSWSAILEINASRDENSTSCPGLTGKWGERYQMISRITYRSEGGGKKDYSSAGCLE